MKMIDGAVVGEGRVAVLRSEFSEESEIRHRTSCINSPCEGDGFARVVALELSDGFTVFFQCVGDSVQPSDALLHGGGCPSGSCPESGHRRCLNVAGGGFRQSSDDLARGRIHRVEGGSVLRGNEGTVNEIEDRVHHITSGS